MSIGGIQGSNQPQAQMAVASPAIASSEESREGPAERTRELASRSAAPNLATLHDWQGTSVNLQA